MMTAPLFAALFGLPSLQQIVTAAVVLLLLFFALILALVAFLRRGGGPAAMSSASLQPTGGPSSAALVSAAAPSASPAAETLPQRAFRLLAFLHDLGLPALAPLLKAVAAGQWLRVPEAVADLLDKLDDKEERAELLGRHFYTQLDRRLADPAKRQELFARISRTTGAVIAESSPAAE